MQDFCDEETLLDILRMKRATMYRLRTEKQFPYIAVTPQVRLYYLPNVAKWLLDHERVLNRARVSES
jgi:hypothetical protein